MGGHVMTLWISRIFILAAFTFSTTSNAISTTPATGVYEDDLGSLYGAIKTIGFIYEICSESFPELRPQINDAYISWRARYKPFHQEVKLRMNNVLLMDSGGNLSRRADEEAQLNDAMQVLKGKIREMYTKGGAISFKEACMRYPTSIEGSKWDIQKRYPDQVETIRAVHLDK